MKIMRTYMKIVSHKEHKNMYNSRFMKSKEKEHEKNAKCFQKHNRKYEIYNFISINMKTQNICMYIYNYIYIYRNQDLCIYI